LKPVITPDEVGGLGHVRGTVIKVHTIDSDYKEDTHHAAGPYFSRASVTCPLALPLFLALTRRSEV
jgi:hypothetical protein